MSDVKSGLGLGRLMKGDLSYLNPLKQAEAALDTLGLAPDMPDIEEPKTAPTTDDKTSRRNVARRQSRMYAGRGRQGTALTAGSGGGSNKLG